MILHIPKCGGVWVASAIQSVTNIKWQPYRLQHDDMSAMQHPDVLHTLVFVRHPVTWYRSYWRYRMQQNLVGPWPSFDQPPKVIDACGDPNFDTFIENCLNRCPGYVSKMFEKFGSANIIGQQESLKYDLIDALTAVGESFNEYQIMEHPRQNTSTSVQVKWSPRLWDRMLDAESGAMEKYGYA